MDGSTSGFNRKLGSGVLSWFMRGHSSRLRHARCVLIYIHRSSR